MPIHLMTYTDGGKPIEVRDYFVEPENVTWDGLSPLGLEVAAIVAAARTYAVEHWKTAVRFDNLELASDDEPASRRYYFFKVRFETCDDDPRSVEVFVDLRGSVIRPEIRRFETRKEYDRYAKERDLGVEIPQEW